MRTISEQELKDILDKHDKWLRTKHRSKWTVSSYLGHEYWVSDRGLVASIFNSCGSLRKEPRILKNRITKNGYYSVAFKGRNKLVHRIVADAFVGDVSKGIVHHVDAVKTNNSASNLKIVDPSFNNSEGYKTRNANKKIITEMIRYYRK